MNVTKEGIEVKVGQLWEDLDKRMRGRRCFVCEVSNGKAVMRGEYYQLKTTKISISRMHKSSTGWKLIKTGTEPTSEAEAKS